MGKEKAGSWWCPYPILMLHPWLVRSIHGEIATQRWPPCCGWDKSKMLLLSKQGSASRGSRSQHNVSAYHQGVPEGHEILCVCVCLFWGLLNI